MMQGFNTADLDLTSEDFLLDEVGCHIQENLEDEIVREALESGVDLRQYVRQIESELVDLENASIQDYISESENIATLHTQIVDCDKILERMEGMLQSFQSDLGNISSEIQLLQRQSIEMNIKLKNRQAVRGELSQFVGEMVIEEKMINVILDVAVTEREFLEQLHDLNHKINFVKEQSFKEARSCSDVRDILEKLKIKAITKIREFLLQKIYSFRKPMANYQLAQNVMLKFRFYNEFLMNTERHVAKEIRDEYIETTSKIYYSYFKAYISKLMKLQFEAQADKDDVMGSMDEIGRRSLFSSRPANLRNRSTVFTLSTRGSVLTTELEAPIIVPAQASKGEQRHTFESIFRSIHYALLDNACREYLFLCDFFIVSGAQAQELFHLVQSKSLTLLQKHMEAHIGDCFDGIALALCLQIVARYRVMMTKRAVPVLDAYWASLHESLFSRLAHVFELNITSVAHCDPSRFGSVDVRPHTVTRRYAEFAAALGCIAESTAAGGAGNFVVPVDPRWQRLLARLRAEVETFVAKLAAEFPQRREQLICLINNYDMMLSVLAERVSEDAADWQSFQEALTNKTSELVEEMLATRFGFFINFLRDAEGALDRGDEAAALLRHQEARVQQVVREWNSTWKQHIDSIQQEIMSSFTNFRNGQAIFQATLTQLIQYYHRFQKVMAQLPFSKMAAKNDVINMHHLMVEIKKLSKQTF